MKKFLGVLLGFALVASSFSGCRTLPGGSGVATNTSSSGGSSGQTSTVPVLNSISTSINGQFGVTVGSGGAIFQATSTGSASSAQFPTWNAVASGTANTLLGVAFDTNVNTTAVANVLAVGSAGTVLENTSSGGAGWVVGNNASGLKISDAACSSTSVSSFGGVSFNGVSVFSNTNQSAVIVGGPFADACGKTKGVIAVSTSVTGTLPYNGFKLVDTFGKSNTPIPNVNFLGASFAQDATSSTFVVVVGSNGSIFVGNTASDLTAGTSWAQNSTSDGTLNTLNGVAVAPDNFDAIAVGNGSSIYVNNNLGVAATWTRLSIPSGIPAANFYGVHFAPTSGTLTAVVAGQTTAGAPMILLVSNCCNAASTVTNVTLPAVTGLPTGSSLLLSGVWASVGPPGGLAVTSGGITGGSAAGGFVLESDNGGAAPWSQDLVK